MVYFSVVISATLLALASAHSHNIPPPAAAPASIPQCPIDPASISPCICYPASAIDTSIANATLDCSAVNDYTVFANLTGLTTSTDILTFARIIIANNSLLTEIPSNAFGNAVAEVYEITGNKKLTDIRPGFLNPVAQPFVLNLEDNFITTFPFDDLKKLTKIEFILLGYNQLDEIPNNAFNNVGPNSLNDILLNNNKIATIGIRAFGGVNTALNAIVLNHNEIGELLPQSMCVDSNPAVIVLDYNKISKVASNAFTCGTGLANHTTMKNNLFTTLEQEQFSAFFSALSKQPTYSADFGGNPIKCDDCLAKWIKDSTFRKPLLQGVVCVEPRLVAGKEVAELPTQHFKDLGCI